MGPPGLDGPPALVGAPTSPPRVSMVHRGGAGRGGGARVIATQVKKIIGKHKGRSRKVMKDRVAQTCKNRLEQLLAAHVGIGVDDILPLKVGRQCHALRIQSQRHGGGRRLAGGRRAGRKEVGWGGKLFFSSTSTSTSTGAITSTRRHPPYLSTAACLLPTRPLFPPADLPRPPCLCL